MLDRLRATWAIETAESYPSSHHRVARARLADGTPAVLKLGPPERLDVEAAALTAYGFPRTQPLRGPLDHGWK